MKISADTAKAPLLSVGYPQTPGVYDEMSAAPGILRPHWDEFINSLSALGDQELAPPLANGKAAHSGKRRHLQRLWRSAGNGPARGIWMPFPW